MTEGEILGLSDTGKLILLTVSLPNCSPAMTVSVMTERWKEDSGGEEAYQNRRKMKGFLLTGGVRKICWWHWLGERGRWIGSEDLRERSSDPAGWSCQGRMTRWVISFRKQPLYFLQEQAFLECSFWNLSVTLKNIVEKVATDLKICACRSKSVTFRWWI